MVKSPNVNIIIFICFNPNKGPYVPFNTSSREFIQIQGQDGEELIKMLHHVEAYGDNMSNHIKLMALAEIYFKVWEYARAINAAVVN